MKKTFVFATFVFILAGCQEADENALEDLLNQEPEVEAEAVIYSLAPSGENIYNVQEREVGIARFGQFGNVVSLEITLTGMTPNTSKAVHIHNGSVSEPGRHWNQGSFYAFCNERSLGQLWAKPFAGDVGNVPVDADGIGRLVIQTDLWALNTGDEKDILNKVIIIHDDPEDFVEECDPNHPHNHIHSNPKIGGGTIGLIGNVKQVTAFKPTMIALPEFTICP